MRKQIGLITCCGLAAILSNNGYAEHIAGRWVSVEGGYAYEVQPSTTSTQWLPDSTPPDDYVPLNFENPWTVGVGAGYQFLLPGIIGEAGDSEHWFPSDRLGLFYNYSSQVQLSGQINKWQTVPVYSYSYNVNSNTLWLDNQLDIIECGQFTPFFDVAIGSAWNHSAGYQESALPGVPSSSVRVASAAFATNTQASFAWRVGAGVNFKLTPALNLGVLYHYSNLGVVSTGASLNYPSMTGISNSITSNEVLASLRYDIGG